MFRPCAHDGSAFTGIRATVHASERARPRLRDLCGYSLVITLRSKQQSNTCTSIIIRAKLIYEASHVGHASCDTGCDGTAPLGKNSPRKSRPLPAALAVTSQRASLS